MKLSTTWPQICAAARVQLAKPRQAGDELAMMLASGILGMDRTLSKELGGKTPEEEFLPETLEEYAAAVGRATAKD